MSINHGRAHIRVPQQFLDRSDIRPGLQKVSCETVSKRVATDLLVNARTKHSSSHKLLNRILMHVVPAKRS